MREAADALTDALSRDGVGTKVDVGFPPIDRVHRAIRAGPFIVMLANAIATASVARCSGQSASGPFELSKACWSVAMRGSSLASRLVPFLRAYEVGWHDP